MDVSRLGNVAIDFEVNNCVYVFCVLNVRSIRGKDSILYVFVEDESINVL